jgi:hypothetical protein
MRAVGEPGDDVGMRQVGDARLVALHVGDVLVGRDPPAVRHDLPLHPDDAAVAEMVDAVDGDWHDVLAGLEARLRMVIGRGQGVRSMRHAQSDDIA